MVDADMMGNINVYGTVETSEYHWITMAVDRMLWEFSNRNGNFRSPSPVIHPPEGSPSVPRNFEFSDGWLVNVGRKMNAAQDYFSKHTHLPLFETRCGNVPDSCDYYGIAPIIATKQRAKNPTSTKFLRVKHRCPGKKEYSPCAFTAIATKFIHLPQEYSRTMWHLYRRDQDHFGGFDPLTWKVEDYEQNALGFGFDEFMINEAETEAESEEEDATPPPASSSLPRGNRGARGARGACGARGGRGGRGAAV
ncbi:hypothetical protein MBANPS3_011653 [Mucor bainieri]